MAETDDVPVETGAPVEAPAAEVEETNLLGGVDAAPEAPTEDARPEWLPEKFKTPEDLAKSYRELERKLRDRPTAPEPPESYELELPEGVELADEDVEFLRDLGLDNDKAQKLADFLLGDVANILQEAQADLQHERLANSWGMNPQSHEYMQRLSTVKAWANQNLPDSVVAEMAKSANGVNALFQMMESGAQVAHAVGQGGPGRPSPVELQELMADPRYQYDEDYRNMVRQKFVEAYD